MTDKETIRQYRYLLEQIATLSENDFTDNNEVLLCSTHIIAIHKIAIEALGMDGT